MFEGEHVLLPSIHEIRDENTALPQGVHTLSNWREQRYSGDQRDAPVYVKTELTLSSL